MSMSTIRSGFISRGKLLLVISGLVAVSSYAMYSLHLPIKQGKMSLHATTTTTPILPTPPVKVQADTSVSDLTVATIVNSVAKVPGIDELVVLPSSDGTGYVVSATVNLANNLQLSSSTVYLAEQNDVQTFYQRLYGNLEDVEDAKVYFVMSGHIVGGAGLGRAAYKSLTTSTVASDAGFLDAMKSLPQSSQDGPQDDWFSQRDDSQIS